jgi:hypothetical protein
MSDSVKTGYLSYSFPAQKVRDSQKKEKFFKECIDAGISISEFGSQSLQSNSLRSSKKNKIINYNLLNNIVSKEEMDKAVNPFKINYEDFQKSYRNFPLVNSNINVLTGEERKRLYNPVFTMVNHDAVSEKVDKIQEEFFNFSMERVQSKAYNPEQVQREIEKFEREKYYTFRDRREKMANEIIRYLYQYEGLKEKFSRGFEDLLTVGEEIYSIDIFGGEPSVRKCDPVNFHVLKGGESYKIEDHDIIVEDGYVAPGEVIDRYFDELKDNDIKKLEQGNTFNSSMASSLFRNQIKEQSISLDSIISEIGMEGVFGLSELGKSAFGGSFDTEGNVRVTRVLWKGLTRIGFKYYFDEDGHQLYDMVPDGYEPIKELGEEIEWKWISEWYEGTRIAEDIYVKMQPVPFQIRRMDNPSACMPPVVGTISNVNTSKAMSLVDMTKDYQYMYNGVMNKLDDMIAKFVGKVAKINISTIPDGWSMSQYMYFIYKQNMMIEDPFNEGKKGAATGKLAGSMSQTGNSSEIGDADAIERFVSILGFIEERVDQITGVTKQRKGNIDNRETVGGVERSVLQSSHITEKWFGIHDDTKTRVLKVLLEAAKVAWNGKSFKRNYILDDSSIGMLDFDSQSFNEAEYGILGGVEDNVILQKLQGLSEAFMQNGGSLSMVADLVRTKDSGELYRKIKTYEDELNRQKQEEGQMQQEMAQQQIQAQKEIAEQKLNLDKYKIDSDNQTRIRVAEINAFKFVEDQDLDNNGIPDQLEVGKLAIEELKANSDAFDKQNMARLKQREIESKDSIEKSKVKLEERKLDEAKKLQKQKDDAAMEREKLKAKTALKNKVTGEK